MLCANIRSCHIYNLATNSMFCSHAERSNEALHMGHCILFKTWQPMRWVDDRARDAHFCERHYFLRE